MTNKTIAQLKSDVTTSFPDNHVGQITAAVLRTFQNNLTDSVVGLSTGFGISQSIVTSTQTNALLSLASANRIIATDNADASAFGGSLGLLEANLTTTGTTSTGNRSALIGSLVIDGVNTSQPAGNMNYAALQSVTQINCNAGGTDLTNAGCRGALQGCAFNTIAGTSVVNLQNITGMEIDIGMYTGSSSRRKSGLSIATLGPTDVVQGATYDGALSISRQAGGVGWLNGILFSDYNGQQPFSATGTLIKSQGAHTVTNGIDISSYTFTGSAIKTPSFTVGGDGRSGIGVAPTVNQWLKVGDGTGGSLVDSGNMAFKGLITASAAGVNPQALQVNVNLPLGVNTGANPIIGIIGRVDERGSSGTGDCVALWGDTFVRAPADRATWGINAYVQIDEPTYTAAAVNELGLFNNASAVNPGGPLHAVSGGSQATQFGINISGRVNHGLQINNDSTNPIINAIYYGALAAGNTPTGTPQFVVTRQGNVSAGTTASTSTWVRLAGPTAAISQFNLSTGTDPASPNDGDMWLSANTTAGLKIRLNGVTRTITVT